MITIRGLPAEAHPSPDCVECEQGPRRPQQRLQIRGVDLSGCATSETSMPHAVAGPPAGRSPSTLEHPKRQGTVSMSNLTSAGTHAGHQRRGRASPLRTRAALRLGRVSHDVEAAIRFSRNPLYAVVHEACYADGGATRSAAAKILTGEARLPVDVRRPRDARTRERRLNILACRDWPRGRVSPRKPEYLL
jgi:hypothetical protein